MSKSQNKFNWVSATQNIPSRFLSVPLRLFTVAAAAKTGIVSEKILRESSTKRLLNEKPFSYCLYLIKRAAELRYNHIPPIIRWEKGWGVRGTPNFLTRQTIRRSRQTKVKDDS